ncbi:hypothetical protein THAOC_24282, partial [Thalassiosira oceanica]
RADDAVFRVFALGEAAPGAGRRVASRNRLRVEVLLTTLLAQKGSSLSTGSKTMKHTCKDARSLSTPAYRTLHKSNINLGDKG